MCIAGQALIFAVHFTLIFAEYMTPQLDLFGFGPAPPAPGEGPGSYFPGILCATVVIGALDGLCQVNQSVCYCFPAAPRKASSIALPELTGLGSKHPVPAVMRFYLMFFNQEER